MASGLCARGADVLTVISSPAPRAAVTVAVATAASPLSPGREGPIEEPARFGDEPMPTPCCARVTELDLAVTLVAA